MADGKRTVFVVDDDATVRTALLHLIRAAGYDAEGLESGAAFLQRAAPTPPACLLLDVRMPGMSGLDLQERIRGTPHAVPIVFITGHADQGARRRALEQGAVALLKKPLDEDVLLEAIERAFASAPLES
jgi:FixJ family two-component response regulator